MAVSQRRGPLFVLWGPGPFEERKETAGLHSPLLQSRNRDLAISACAECIVDVPGFPGFVRLVCSASFFILLLRVLLLVAFVATECFAGMIDLCLSVEVENVKK
jgi:hypothetical protein